MSKNNERTYNFKLPPGFEFPSYPGAETFEKLMKMKPLPGREEEYHLAMKTIEEVCNTDFSKPIDINNACGHRAPGVVMKDGYCLKCYEELNIAELQQLINLSKRVGPEEAARMMSPGTSSSAGSSSRPAGSTQKAGGSQKTGTSSSEDTPIKKKK